MFSGSVVKAQCSSCYLLKFKGDPLPLCAGGLYSKVGVLSELEAYNVGSFVSKLNYGWGYDSKDAQILAVTMLGMYAGTGGLAAQSHVSYYYPNPPLFPSVHAAREFVKEHYKAFTSEVIANLPDNWTMTMEDIDKWVKSKQNQNENIPKG